MRVRVVIAKKKGGRVSEGALECWNKMVLSVGVRPQYACTRGLRATNHVEALNDDRVGLALNRLDFSRFSLIVAGDDFDLRTKRRSASRSSSRDAGESQSCGVHRECSDKRLLVNCSVTYTRGIQPHARTLSPLTTCHFATTGRARLGRLPIDRRARTALRNIPTAKDKGRGHFLAPVGGRGERGMGGRGEVRCKHDRPTVSTSCLAKDTWTSTSFTCHGGICQQREAGGASEERGRHGRSKRGGLWKKSDGDVFT